MNYRSIYKKLLLISLLFASVQPATAMNIETAKTALSVLAKGAYWGILSNPTYKTYKEYKTVKSDELRPSEATKEQDEFVRKTLKEHGFPASFYETIKVQANFFGWRSQRRILFIQEHFDPNDTDIEQVNMAKAFIIHEAGHILNRDLYRGWLASSAMPFIVHFGLQMLFPQSNQSTSVVKSVSLLPAAVLKIGLASLINIFYAHHVEAKADDEIVKRVTDPTILHAINEAFLYKYKRAYDVEKIPTTLTWRDRLAWMLEEPYHPFILDRVKKFDDACKALEAKQVTNQ